jgi:thiol-disulfide isomerase/thioredoxin
MTAVLAAVLAGLIGVAPAQAGQPAPALVGVPGTFSENVTLVVFFATWCKPCHRAFPELSGISRQVGGRVRMVLVEAGEDPSEVRRFLAANPPPPGAIIGTDVSGETRRLWGVNSFPSFYVVGRDGAIQRTHRGWGGDSAALIARWLHAALGDARPHARRPGWRAPRH